MRIVVPLALVLIGLWLWLDAADEPAAERPLDAGPETTGGPELDARGAPLRSQPLDGVALEVRVRLHGKPAVADVSLRRLRDEDDLLVRAVDVGEVPVHARATSRAGRTRFGALEPGAYHLTARGADGGFATATVQVRAAGDTATLDLVAGSHTLTGRLVDGARPATGWSVQVRPASDFIYGDYEADVDPVWSAATDSEGRFRIPDLPFGRYVVTCVRSGRARIDFDSVLVPTDGERSFDVGCRYGTLSGSVRDLGTDAPIAGAVVRTVTATDGWHRSDHVRTDEHGRFAVATGDWVLVVHVTAEGYTPRRMDVQDGVVDLSRVIHLARCGRVAGRVVSAQGDEPLEGAPVWIVTRERDGSPHLRSVTSDREGRFHVDNVATGRVRVYVLGGGLYPAVLETADHDADPTRCVVRPGETTELTLRAGRSVSLAGRVLDSAGVPVAGAQVVPDSHFSFRGVTFPMASTPTRTDASGAFELHDLVPGSHLAAYVRVEGRARGRAEFHPERGQTRPVDVRLEPAERLVLEVLDAETDEPVPGAVVRMDDFWGSYAGQVWLTDARGRVTWEHVSPPFELESVVARGYMPWFSEGGPWHTETTPRTLRLRRGAVISGRVRLPSGLPAWAADIELELDSDEDHLDELSLYTSLDGRGQFAFDGVPPGRHTLSIRAFWNERDYEVEREVDAGTRDVDLRLAPAPEDNPAPPLQVRVRDPHGRDLARGFATLFYRVKDDRVVRDTNVLRDGTTLWRAPGHSPRWLVMVPQRDASGLKPDLAPALLGPLADDERDLDVRLQPGRRVGGRVLDPSGRPVAGVDLSATFDVRLGASREAHQFWLADARSDAGGRFELVGLPAEGVRVHVNRLPFGWAKPRAIDVGATEAALTVRVEPAATVTVRVVDWRGNPVREANVRWIPRREGWKARDVEDRRTDARGRAEFGHLRPDQPVDLIVVAPDERTDCLTYELKRAPLEDRVVTMPRGYTLRVTVLDARGHPVPKAKIWRKGRYGWTAQGHTDESGVQVLDRVRGPEALLRPEAKDVEGEVVRVPADAGSVTLRIGR